MSGLQTLDSLTKQTLSMDPSEAAATNRKAMKTMHIPDATIDELLLSDKLTPTEKTLAVGYLHSLSGAQGLGSLASFIARSDTRYGAYAALRSEEHTSELQS